MTLVRRYHGWTMSPPFVPNGATKPVSLAVDDNNLTQWIGEPPTVVQTPLSEVHQIEIVLSRRLTLRAAIAGTRYTWHTRRGAEHDELIDLLRAKGAKVSRANRTRLSLALGAAAVLVVASVASVATWVLARSGPSHSDIAALSVQRADLPAGFRAIPSGVVTLLTGAAGSQITDNTAPPALHGLSAQINNRLVKNFENCVGVSHKKDRFYGLAGVLAHYQVAGKTFASRANGGEEIGSTVQYYSSAAAVRADIAQYSAATFPTCFAQSAAQEVYVADESTLASASTVSPVRAYTPITIARGWRRGGVVTVSLPGQSSSFSLVAVLAAHGNEEVYVYAWVANLAKSTGTINAAISAVLARLTTDSSTASA